MFQLPSAIVQKFIQHNSIQCIFLWKCIIVVVIVVQMQTDSQEQFSVFNFIQSSVLVIRQLSILVLEVSRLQ